jgi:sterol 3beta-glucosyltransferase
LRTLLEDARDSDAILFSGLASYVGLAAGEALGKPAIGLGLWPLSPTAEFGSPLLPPWRLPGWLNRWSHHLISAAMWRMFRPATNAALREVLGAPPRRAVWSDYPLLYGVSPQLVPQPRDWAGHWRICGAWQAPVARALDWQPPPALKAFLAAGPRPIYVGFGSMGGFNRKRLVRTLVEGVRGRRVLFWPGWSGIDGEALPANFHVLEAAPHEALFPLVSAVVHHGGAGTTHTAACAGVPSVVVPFAADQFFWADRLARAGVAARAVSQKRLDAAALARQLDFAERPGTQARARALGQAMACEDGTGRTVATLEYWLAAPCVDSSIIQAERHPMAAGA